MANVYATTYAELRNKQLSDDLAQAKRELQTKLTELDGRIATLPPGPERDTATADRERLKGRVDQVDVDSARASSYVKILSEATPPGSPARPRTARDALLAGGLGLLVGILLAALLENLDDSLKSRNQLAKALGDVPVVGVIPAARGAKAAPEQLATLRAPSSPTAEAYRKLRTSLQFTSAGPMRTLQVTSPGPMQGKTTTVANLGVAIAQAGLRAVVVCTDLRRPQLHDLFGVDNATGFTSVLVGAVPLSAAVQPIAEQPRLFVLPSGPLPPNPSELLASRRTVEVLTSLQAEYDVVLLDTPPVLPVADAVVLSCRVDATLIACVADVTTAREAGRAAEALRLVGAPIIGAVLHGTATETLAADLERYTRDDRSLDRTAAKRGRSAQ
jgi:non-specific protein-tyrosine kinase